MIFIPVYKCLVCDQSCILWFSMLAAHEGLRVAIKENVCYMMTDSDDANDGDNNGPPPRFESAKDFDVLLMDVDARRTLMTK